MIYSVTLFSFPLNKSNYVKYTDLSIEDFLIFEIHQELFFEIQAARACTIRVSPVKVRVDSGKVSFSMLRLRVCATMEKVIITIFPLLVLERIRECQCTDTPVIFQFDRVRLVSSASATLS